MAVKSNSTISSKYIPEVVLKLFLGAYLDISEYKDIIYSEGLTEVKFSTTKKNVVPDRMYPELISEIRDCKIVYPLENGILILRGRVQIDFRSQSGNYYLQSVIKETTDYDSVRGALVKLQLVPRAEASLDREYMQDFFNYLINDPEFEFNISQFEDFMNVFNYYKTLSTELNNTKSYEIKSISEPYYFLSIDGGAFDTNYVEREVYDENGVLKGYIISNATFDTMIDDDLLDSVSYLVDVKISGDDSDLRKIHRIGFENIYLSDIKDVAESNVSGLREFVVKNVTKLSGEIIISGELKSNSDYFREFRFLNLYDMGQKIKVDSIDESLRLINRGATGAATELLEYLIGDKEMPNYSRPDVDGRMEPYLKGLNDSQKKAFRMAVDGSPVSLIKGPPGTGKTHVINAIVQYITKERHEKVIISSQTHIAIDNVLDKLMENKDLVVPKRITNRKNKYSDQELDKTLYKTWGNKFEEFNSEVSDRRVARKVSELMEGFRGDKRFSFGESSDSESYQVIGATTTTSAIAGKKGLEVFDGFDWLIIDEVSKCPITEVLRYLPYVSRIIMVGDDYQLAPLLEFSKEDVENLPSYNEDAFDDLKQTYEDSVFARVMKKAIDSNRIVQLNENYRSVDKVLGTYNIFYNHQLIGRREETRPEKVHFKSEGIGSDFENSDIFFVEVLYGREAKKGTSRYNVQEAYATGEYLSRIMETIEHPENVTVAAIFPYAAQIEYFQKHFLDIINDAKKTFKSFDIDTVDAFQGKESDIVLVNTVVTDSSQGNFLSDFRRINVSMSRARDKLFVFGNSVTLSKIDMKTNKNNSQKYFKDIIEFIKIRGQLLEYKG